MGKDSMVMEDSSSVCSIGQGEGGGEISSTPTALARSGDQPAN